VTCRRRFFICVLLVASAAVVTAAPASAQNRSSGVGTVVVVHALEGLPADVYLDGASTPALRGFDFRRVTDPLVLPAGSHRADVRRAGDPPTATPQLSGTFDVVADQQITVVALLDPAGAPSWLALPDDGRVGDAAKGELRFRHLAAQGAVTLEVNGTVVQPRVENLSVGGQVAPAALDAGRYVVAVRDATTDAELVPAQEVEVAPGGIISLYLTGRSDNRTLDLLQDAAVPMPAGRLADLQVLPTQVPSGNSGLAGSSDGGSDVGGATAILLGVVALAIVVSTPWWRRRSAEA
jgi:hypothetical protein